MTGWSRTTNLTGFVIVVMNIVLLERVHRPVIRGVANMISALFGTTPVSLETCRDRQTNHALCKIKEGER